MYSVSFDATSLSAAADFFELNPASGKPCILHSVRISAAASETADQLRFTIKRITATFASGSGGSAGTNVKLNVNDPSSGASAETCNTTRATGTAETIWAEGCDVRAGFTFLPTPEMRPEFVNASGVLIVGLEAAPAAATTFSGTLVYEEK
jgi:hypothetical protein